MKNAKEIYSYFKNDFFKSEQFIKIKFCAIERIPILTELNKIHNEKNKIS